jgi:hypothetical protein
MAKRVLTSSVEINAPPQRIWQILNDFNSYPEWNPFIVEIAGTPIKGAKIIVSIWPPEGKRMRFRPKILTAEPNNELRWLGRVWFPGVFDGEHAFELEALDGSRTRFTQSESFKGILVGRFKKTLDRTQRGFELMNEALKQRAERP